ncbi:MAG: hypothetical protein Ct9H300mP21_09530 [Pseudomonadota bacterium]|nr:MAG: hypothetical protein Ct9H300mP21_09530 [Pseudomonadota bacterium]
MEHQQLEERRMQQTVSQLSQDSEGILGEMDLQIERKYCSRNIISLEKTC